ncbi:MAG: hypothetical protein WEB58_07730 [Planctomycetaceae bacterium]
MKKIPLSLLMIGSVLVSALAEPPRDILPQGSRANSIHVANDQINATWLQKVRPLFPEVGLQRSGNRPFFAEVIEVVRVPLEDGQTRVVVWVKVIVPAARVDHGWGELMIFAQADDEQPLARRPTHTLPVFRASEISLVAGRWLQFGKRSSLVSLADLEALKHFQEHGLQRVLWGLSVVATERALVIYLNEGREAFLKQVPLAAGQEKPIQLPPRIRAVHFYHSLAEDMRYAGFKYSDTWEGTILVRLTPADEQSPPVTLEIGTRASSAGIEVEAVEMFLWKTLPTAPTDRPADLMPI